MDHPTDPAWQMEIMRRTLDLLVLERRLSLQTICERLLPQMGLQGTAANFQTLVMATLSVHPSVFNIYPVTMFPSERLEYMVECSIGAPAPFPVLSDSNQPFDRPHEPQQRSQRPPTELPPGMPTDWNTFNYNQMRPIPAALQSPLADPRRAFLEKSALDPRLARREQFDPDFGDRTPSSLDDLSGSPRRQAPPFPALQSPKLERFLDDVVGVLLEKGPRLLLAEVGNMLSAESRRFLKQHRTRMSRLLVCFPNMFVIDGFMAASCVSLHDDCKKLVSTGNGKPFANDDEDVSPSADPMTPENVLHTFLDDRLWPGDRQEDCPTPDFLQSLLKGVFERETSEL